MSEQTVKNENSFGKGKIFVEEKEWGKALGIIKHMFCWCGDGGGRHVCAERWNKDLGKCVLREPGVYVDCLHDTLSSCACFVS